MRSARGQEGGAPSHTIGGHVQVENNIPFSKPRTDSSGSATTYPRARGSSSHLAYSPRGEPIVKQGTLHRNHIPFSQDSDGFAAPVEVGEEPVRGRRHSSF